MQIHTTTKITEITMVARKLWALVFVTICCSVTTNAGFFYYLYFLDNNPKEGVLDRVIRKGEIRLGTSPDYPPFESLRETENGLEILGFDIALARHIAESISEYLDQKIELKIEAAFFNALMAGLEAGSYDFVIAAFAIRPYREQVVDFSIPYYFSEQCCIVSSSETGINNEDDLENKTIAVQTGTSGEELAGGLPGEKKALPTVDMIMVDLTSGASDAAIIDIPVAEYFISSGKDIKIAFTFSDVPEGFGVAMKQSEGPGVIMGIINSTITQLNETGVLETLFETSQRR